MKYQDLFELRRNPEINKKIAGYQEAIKFLESIPDNELRYYGISMTMLPKLGVNPGSSHDTTPLGVYFYPARYYMQLLKSGDEVPYMNNAKYINIIKLKDVKTLWINYANIDEEGLIEDMVSAMAGITGTTLRDTFIDRVTHLAKRETDEYSGDTRIWQAAKYIARTGLDSMKTKSDTSFMTVWNKLLRSVGIMVVIDDGNSVIHENEPNQGVVLDPKAIEGFKTFYNNKPVSDKNLTSGNLVLNIDALYKRAIRSKRRNKLVEESLINNLMHGLYFSARTQSYYSNCIGHGVRWPALESTFPRLVTGGELSFNLTRILQYYELVGFPERLPKQVELALITAWKNDDMGGSGIVAWKNYCQKFNISTDGQ